MKQPFSLLFLFFLTLLYSSNISANEITQQQAFGQISKLFENKDVDYYIISPKDNIENDEWLFFIDAVPYALWEHDCYVVTYPKNTSDQNPQIKQMLLSSPPEDCNYIPYNVKKRDDDDFNTDFILDNSNISRGENSISAKRTYSLIVGGKAMPDEESDRFDYDCRFFYQTLTKRYGVPYDNIYSLLQQCRTYDPVDKKLYPKNLGGGKNVDDNTTYNNIKKYLELLQTKVQANDNLIIFISSHGKVPDSRGCGLSIHQQDLYADDLLPWIKPFLDNHTNVIIILGGCHSKHFAEQLNYPGCVVLASSDGPAYGHKYRLTYFMRCITAALNGQDYDNGKKVNADLNNDSYISISEAFNFAYENLKDRTFGVQQTKMNPYMQSSPDGLAELLAINRVISDLIIRQAPNEELLNNGIFWNSPDIWLRNGCDGKEQPQYIRQSYGTNRACVNVRVRNDGDIKYESGKTLRLYWAQASSMVNQYTFINGKYLDEPTGGHIADIKITDIEPNQSKVFSTWLNIPKELTKGTTHPEHHQFTIFAALVDEKNMDLDHSFMVSKFSGTAQSTYSVIDNADTIRATSMFIYNPTNESKKYNLRFNWRDESSKDIFKYANVITDMSSTAYQSWLRGGKHGSAIVDNNYSPNSTQMLEATSSYNQISMNPYAVGRISLFFDFFDAPKNEERHIIYFVMTDENNNIVGGQTIDLTTPHKTFTAIPVDSLIWEGGIGTINPDPDFPLIPTWYNSKNQKASTNSTLKVTPASGNDTYRIVAITPEGELMDSEVNISLEFGIKYLSLDENAAKGIDIVMQDTPVSGYCLTLASLSTGRIVYTKDLSIDEKNIHIDTDNLSTGIYVLSCTLDGEVINTYKFTK